VYPDPETFNPDRWLLPSYPTFREPLTTHPNLHGYSQFGFGRRTCQGLPIVEQDLFLTMGGMAWALEIRKKRRADGTEVPVHWDDYTPLLIAKPKGFEFDAVVRDEGRRRMLEEMLGEDTLCGGEEEEEEEEECTADEKSAAGKYGLDVELEGPQMSPIEEEVKRLAKGRRGEVPVGEMHSTNVDKGKARSASGSWTESLLVAQGPMIVR
jgi:hypothetical protein